MAGEGQPVPIGSQIDELLRGWQASDSPGLQVAVRRDGEVIHSAGYGLAQIEHQAPITPATVFHVASVSKQFTAAAVILLALGGELSLDDEVRRYVPQLPDFGHRITVRHLIHHTSGLRDQWELLVTAGWRMDDVITTAQIMKLVSRQRRLNFSPGAEHLYSNTGYTLLAEVVERVSGTSFGQYLQETIFGPLGMERTHVHDDPARVVPERAYSYRPHPQHGYSNAVLSYANQGATSLFSTALDLTRWLEALERHQLGHPDFVRAMHDLPALNDGTAIDYAAGLGFGEHRGMQIIGHSGGDAGFRSWCGRVPGAGLSLAICGNISTLDAQGTAMSIVDICLGHSPDMPAAAPPEAARLDACRGLYLLAPYGTVEIALRCGGLRANMGDGLWFDLLPQGELVFQVGNQGVRLEFLPATDGAVDRLLLGRPGTAPVATRVVPCSLDAQYLATCEGTYFSLELETSYRLRSDGHTLWLEHSRHEDIRLLPLAEDRFSGYGRRPGQLVLERRGGEVVAFTLSGGRVRDIRFDRV